MDQNKTKYQRFKYTQETLEKALQAVANGQLSLCKASVAFQIPKSTLSNKINQKVPWQRQMGPPPELTHCEEAKLAQWILNKAKLGFPMHPEDVYDTVKDFLDESQRTTKFTNNRPGKKWLTLFLNRYPDIRKRNSEIISKARAAVTEECIRSWFSELNSFLVEENYTDIKDDPSRIFNTDETGVMTCPKTGIILGPRNYKNTYEIATSKEKESITVLCTFAADGKDVPPFVVYPYKRMPAAVINNHPDSWLIGRSDSGWMVSDTFYAYMKMFYEWLVEENIKLPVLLFLDGHKSHINLKMFEFCQEKGIILFCLYPNATHILQPCDAAIFRPIKNAWKKVVRKHKQATTAPINKQNFAKKFKEAYDKGLKPTTVVNGFRACGLYPLDPNAVDYSKCINSRRQEIIANNNTTSDLDIDRQSDLRSTMKVIESEIGDTLKKEFTQCHLNKCVHNHSYFDLWSKCKSKIENQWQREVLQRPETSQDIPLDLSASSKDSTISQNVDFLIQDARPQSSRISHSIDKQMELSSVCYNDTPNCRITEKIARVQTTTETATENDILPMVISPRVDTGATTGCSSKTEVELSSVCYNDTPNCRITGEIAQVQTTTETALTDQILTSLNSAHSPEMVISPIIEQMPSSPLSGYNSGTIQTTEVIAQFHVTEAGEQISSSPLSGNNNGIIQTTEVIAQIHATEAEETNQTLVSSALIETPSNPSLLFNNSELFGHSTGLDLMGTEDLIEFVLENETNAEEIIPLPSHVTEERLIDSFLKFPEIPKRKKNITKREPMPYGLTGRKYKDYIQKINDEKSKKEQELKKRKDEKQKARELKQETVRKKRAESSKKKKRDYDRENENDQNIDDIKVLQDQNEIEKEAKIPKKRKLEVKTNKRQSKVLKQQNNRESSIPQNNREDVVDNDEGCYDHTKSSYCGKYVIARFNTQRRKRYFVGKILMENKELKKYKVDFLRKKSVVDNVVNFVKPRVEDIAEVNYGDIERVLSEPICSRRGLITFTDVSFTDIE